MGEVDQQDEFLERLQAKTRAQYGGEMPRPLDATAPIVRLSPDVESDHWLVTVEFQANGRPVEIKLRLAASPAVQIDRKIWAGMVIQQTVAAVLEELSRK